MSTIEKAMAKLAGKQPEAEKPSPATAEPIEEQALASDEQTADDPSALAAKQTSNSESKPVPATNTTMHKSPEHLVANQPEVVAPPETLIVRAEQSIKTATPKESISTKYAELDITYLNRKGYISKQSDNKLVKEQFRAVKRKLLNNAFGPLSSTLNNPNLIIVSSCNPHEGKTFSSINLALNIALERDTTVLLVDADVVRPSLVRELGVTVDAGLTEYLSGQVNDVSEIIYNTNIDNFKFIPAGKPHDLSTELLASEKMIALTQELATRYADRVVIFDAPPLLGVNETHVMANHVGQAVIVVEESKTRLNDIKAAVAQLDENLAIGFLVNKSKRAWRDYYGYGYGYNRRD